MMGHVSDIYPSRYEVRTDESECVSAPHNQAKESPQHVNFLRPKFPKTDLRSEGLK